MLSYLFTSSVLLLVVALGYFIFLRQAPALALRRRVLLLGIFGAALIPLCPPPNLSPEIISAQPVHQSLSEFTQHYEAYTSSEPISPTIDAPNNTLRTSTTFWYPGKSLIALYLLGVLLLLSRIGIGLIRIISMRRKSFAAAENNVRILKEGNQAFTFGTTVYLSESVYYASDREVILTHERAHAQQWHTFDALLAEILRAVFWFHPMAWWLREQVQLNLEYLADAAVLGAGYDKRDYQLSLVAHQQGVDLRTSLLPQFAAKGLKRRIQMMGFRAGSQVRSWLATAGLVACTLLAFMVSEGKAQDIAADATAASSSVPNTDFGVLTNNEPHELDIFFKRLPSPLEVAALRQRLQVFYNRDFYIFHDCTDPAGTVTFGIGMPNKMTHQVKIAPGERTELPRRFQLKQDGEGGSGGAVFRPSPLPTDAPEGDVVYRLDGKWASISLNPNQPYTEQDFTAKPLSASLNCQLGLTADNAASFSIGRHSTTTPLQDSTPEEYVNSYIKGFAEGSGTKTVGIAFFLAEEEVSLTEFYAKAKADNQLLTVARRMNTSETYFVIRLDPVKIIGQ